MKIKKCFLIPLLSLFLFLFTTINSYAIEFTDNLPGSWYYEYVNYASNKGWIAGYGNGKFGPNDTLTKAQAITIITRALGLESTNAKGPWYQGFVERGVLEGYVFDLSGMDEPISRYEMAKMIYFAYSFDKELFTDIDSPFLDIDDPYVNILNHYGIIAGINTTNGLIFSPEGQLTRAQICTMLMRVDKLFQNNMQIPKIEEEKPIEIPIPTPPKIKLVEDMSFLSIYEKDINNSDSVATAIAKMASENKFTAKLTYRGNEHEADKVFYDFQTKLIAFVTTYPEYFGIYSDAIIESKTSDEYNWNIVMTASPIVNLTEEQSINKKEILFSNSKKILEQLINEDKITIDMTDKEKAYVISKWVIENNYYDRDINTSSHYGADAFIDGTLVCDGYTSLINTMLRYLGIECYAMTGITDGENHSWSIANLDGQWLIIDGSYMDPVVLDKDGNRHHEFNEDYFAISFNQLMKLNPNRTFSYNNLEALNIEVDF